MITEIRMGYATLCGDQLGVERIVLGAAQMYPTKRLDLHRLQHQTG